MDWRTLRTLGPVYIGKGGEVPSLVPKANNISVACAVTSFGNWQEGQGGQHSWPQATSQKDFAWRAAFILSAHVW